MDHIHFWSRKDESCKLPSQLVTFFLSYFKVKISDLLSCIEMLEFFSKFYKFFFKHPHQLTKGILNSLFITVKLFFIQSDNNMNLFDKLFIRNDFTSFLVRVLTSFADKRIMDYTFRWDTECFAFVQAGRAKRLIMH